MENNQIQERECISSELFVILGKLEYALRKGQVAHKNFDMNVYNMYANDKNSCGTAGCAVGQLPALFPGAFRWNCNNVVHELSGQEYDDYFMECGMSKNAIRHLFFPEQDCRDVDRFGGSSGGLENAGPHYMAWHIGEYLKRVDTFSEVK